MISLEMLSFCRILFLFSFGYLIAEIIARKTGKDNDKTYQKYARAILLIICSVIMIWLVCNKELFHWNYDIATGEAVDHYSTYPNCMIYVILAIITNNIAILLGMKKITKE